jgi:tellurite resistance protein
MTAQPTPAYWRSKPPAIFPSFLGLFGLGLGWRRAAEIFAVPGWIGEVVLWATLALYLIGALSYMAKTLARPGVVAQDMGSVPGRAGVGAISLGLLLVAVMVQPVSTGLALVLLGMGLVGHAVLAVMAIRIILSLPSEQRHVMPSWHLAFVAFIVGPISAVPLGLTSLSYAILWLTVGLSVLIYVTSVKHISATPPPLRPLMAIHLAPFSLFTTVASALGHPRLAMVFALFATLILIALVLRQKWLRQGGFTPLWSAFTFPLAAYSIALLNLGGQSTVIAAAGFGVLVVASALIPLIVIRVLRLWASGKLAMATKAAVA